MIIMTADEQTNRHRAEKEARAAAARTHDHDSNPDCCGAAQYHKDLIEAEIVTDDPCDTPADPSLAGVRAELLAEINGEKFASSAVTDDNLKAKTDSPNPKDLVGAMKPPLDLVPSALTIHVAGVMALGARKYGKMNWRQHKVKYSIYLAAALRHLAQAADGEDLDPESGCPHLAHAAACCGIVLDAVACDMVIDDRGSPGPASRLLAANTKKA
jgi:hypothetical protein